jgi:TolB-like protein
MKIFLTIFLTFLMVFNCNLSYAEQSPLVKTIAILDFENNTGLMSQDGLKKGLSDSLTNSLSRYQKLNILERSRLKDAISEITLNQSALVSPDSASKIGKITGSQYVILGSVSRLGDTFEIAVRVVDVESSKITFGRSVRCSNEDAIYKGIDYLSLETASNLGEEIDPRVMDQARKDAENFVKAPTNNNTLLWVGGGVLGIAAISGIVIAVVTANKKTTNVQNVCIGSNCTSTTKPVLRRTFGFEF